MLRSVLDTNVVLAAKLSGHPQSPNAEIITRWMAGEFIWLVSDDVAFLLVTLNGAATHLVTYDEHLKDVGVFYPEFITCEPVRFLFDLRTV